VGVMGDWQQNEEDASSIARAGAGEDGAWKGIEVVEFSQFIGESTDQVAGVNFPEEVLAKDGSALERYCSEVSEMGSERRDGDEVSVSENQARRGWWWWA